MQRTDTKKGKPNAYFCCHRHENSKNLEKKKIVCNRQQKTSKKHSLTFTGYDDDDEDHNNHNVERWKIREILNSLTLFSSSSHFRCIVNISLEVFVIYIFPQYKFNCYVENCLCERILFHFADAIRQHTSFHNNFVGIFHSILFIFFGNFFFLYSSFAALLWVFFLLFRMCYDDVLHTHTHTHALTIIVTPIVFQYTIGYCQ